MQAVVEDGGDEGAGQGEEDEPVAGGEARADAGEAWAWLERMGFGADGKVPSMRKAGLPWAAAAAEEDGGGGCGPLDAGLGSLILSPVELLFPGAQDELLTGIAKLSKLKKFRQGLMFRTVFPLPLAYSCFHLIVKHGCCSPLTEPFENPPSGVGFCPSNRPVESDVWLTGSVYARIRLTWLLSRQSFDQRDLSRVCPP